jgi:hypothetical protein
MQIKLNHQCKQGDIAADTLERFTSKPDVTAESDKNGIKGLVVFDLAQRGPVVPLKTAQRTNKSNCNRNTTDCDGS